MSDMFERLAAPFPPEVVSWRVGVSNKKKRQRELNDNNAKATKGQVLAYIDARDVMDRLDSVCGPDGWQNRYTHAEKKTVCEIGIRTEDGEWIWKADGAGESDIEAEKGALSDAFKRAAVRWGIGRYLYDMPTPWVDLDEYEQITPAERRKLEALLRGKAGPSVVSPPAQKQAPVAAEETTAFQAAKVAIDMCGGDEAKLRQWGADNAGAMEKLKAEAKPIYEAVRRYWLQSMKSKEAA